MKQSEPFPFAIIPVPEHSPARGRRRVILGVAIMVLAALLTAGSALAGEWISESEEITLAIYSIGGLAGYSMFLIGARMINQGRRMQAIPAARLLAQDSRAPVLFLRSFEDDDLIDPTPRLIPMGDMMQRRYEESLCTPLSQVGPVVSIGRPGNDLVLLGGARLFVQDDNWQTAVEFLRSRAAAVVILVGRTEGVWWEITTSLKTVPLEQILFFFPYVEDIEKRRSLWQRFFHYIPARVPLSSKAYQRMEAERQARWRLFRQRIQPMLPAPLPETLGSCQFVDFLSGARSRQLETIRPWWSPLSLLTPSTRKMSCDLRRTLAPFIEKLSASRSEQQAQV